MTIHTISPIVAIPANQDGRGNLAGFEARCSCGLSMSSTIRTNLVFDTADHLRYFEAKARKGRRG